MSFKRDMDVKPCTEQWQRTIFEQSRLLKQIHEQYKIADDIKVIRIAGPNKLHYEKQLSIVRGRKRAIIDQIKADLEQCSSQLLEPLLDKVHASLPLELRESIYEHVFDISKPIVIPQMELPNIGRTEEVQPNSVEASKPAKARHVDLNPFAQDYCFSAAVMGSRTSTEMQNLVLRKTPFYFRGSSDAPCVRDLLNTEIRTGVYFRDLVHYLRVYLRCEDLGREAKYFAPGMSTNSNASSVEYALFDKSSTHAMYLDRLEGLQTLNYADHTVTLELCVFAPAMIPKPHSIKRSLYETVEPLYRHAKNRGADVKVRYEEFITGAGQDWTKYLDMNGHESIQSKQPHRTLKNLPPPACSLDDLFSAPILTSETNISWKHGLFDGNFSQCHCEPCEAYKKSNTCPNCGGSHCSARLSLDDDEGDNIAPRLPRQRVRRRRVRNEQLTSDSTEQEQTSGSGG